MGRREEAIHALEALEELGKHRYVEAYYRALLHISLGQKDAAISALEQSYAERDGDDIGVIKVDPLLDSLRGDPRFEALVQKVIASKIRSKIVKIDISSPSCERLNVYKVAVVYAVVGWLLVQVATQVFPFFEIPNPTVRLVVLAIVIGFPIALIVAWAFELTPEGLKRTEDADLIAQGHRNSYVWIYVVIVGALLSIGLFFIGRYSADQGGCGSPSNQRQNRSRFFRS